MANTENSTVSEFLIQQWDSGAWDTIDNGRFATEEEATAALLDLELTLGWTNLRLVDPLEGTPSQQAPATEDPEAAGIECCEEDVENGADPVDLCKPGQLGADEALINAMGRTWVLRAAGVSSEDSEELWDKFGVPWCERYNAAYTARARELAAGL